VHIISIVLSFILLTLNLKYIKEITSRIDEVNKTHLSSSEKGLTHKKKSAMSGSSSIDMINQTDSRETTLETGGDAQQEDVILDWSELTIYDKWSLFSGWSLIMIIGNVVTLISSVFLLVSTRTSQRDGERMLGIAGFCILVSLMKYWETAKCYNIILNTMINSASVFIKATIGSFPIFIGFALLGICLFIENDRYSSFSMGLYHLFSLMNGDLVFVSFFEFKEVNYLMSQLYLYIYLFVSV